MNKKKKSNSNDDDDDNNNAYNESLCDVDVYVFDIFYICFIYLLQQLTSTNLCAQ